MKKETTSKDFGKVNGFILVLIAVGALALWLLPCQSTKQSHSVVIDGLKVDTTGKSIDVNCNGHDCTVKVSK